MRRENRRLEDNAAALADELGATSDALTESRAVAEDAQPASALVAGGKDVENRSWRPSARHDCAEHFFFLVGRPVHSRVCFAIIYDDRVRAVAGLLCTLGPDATP